LRGGNREQWLKLIEGVLEGTLSTRKSVSRTYDEGLTIEPFVGSNRVDHGMSKLSRGCGFHASDPA
jgi:hypothetical protein